MCGSLRHENWRVEEVKVKPRHLSMWIKSLTLEIKKGDILHFVVMGFLREKKKKKKQNLQLQAFSCNCHGQRWKHPHPVTAHKKVNV